MDKGLIGKFLELTYTQWIFCNITKHHHTNNTIKLDAHRDVLREIECQLDIGITALPSEYRCLLEIPPDDLLHLSTDH